MTTATANRAPTEAEIRDAIEDRAQRYARSESGRVKLGEAIDKVLDTLAYIDDPDPSDEDAGVAVASDIWTDLRPSEARYLRELIDGARDELMTRLWPDILLVVVEAGMRFAKRYPDAPRATVEPTGPEDRILDAIASHAAS